MLTVELVRRGAARYARRTAGAVRVPLNARLAADEQGRMLAAAGVRLLVHDVAQGERAGELASLVDGLQLASLGAAAQAGPLDLLAEMGQASDADPRVPAGADGPVLLIYTSGTTGALKAVIHTQASWAAITANVLANLVSPGRADVSSLRTAFYGASPMPLPLLEQVLGSWGHRLVQYYGQTEAPLAITVLDAAPGGDRRRRGERTG